MTETIWDRICEYEFVLETLGILVFALGILTLFSLPYVEPGSAEYTVSMYNLLAISVFLVVLLTARFTCR